MGIETIGSLLRFIEKSPSVYHVVQNLENELDREGFHQLKEKEKWQLKAGEKYYVNRNGSSLISFCMPKEAPKGYLMMASHSDSPSFQIKENPEMELSGYYTRMNIEKYGGMLCAPWFDRPLSAAGRVCLRTEEGIESRLVDLGRPMFLIPSLAIHMDREANSSASYNPQKDMLPLYGEGKIKGKWKEKLALKLGVLPKQILSTELFLYNAEKGVLWGEDDAFFSAPKLDDLACLYPSFRGFLKAENKAYINMHLVFDNEEVGSTTKQGADSGFLQDVMSRIEEAMSIGTEGKAILKAGSMMISADNAHALHPNHTEKADPVNRPKMNGGIVIKRSANQKYTTDALSQALVMEICEKAKLPYQIFTNRADIPGGSTLGNISNSHVSLNTADIGLAQLAMHSCYETAGAKDPSYLESFSQAFYETNLQALLK
jgi:aspartyl aminopeptidase